MNTHVRRLYDGLKFRAAITPSLHRLHIPEFYRTMHSQSMSITNQCWSGPGIRKFHLEVACVEGTHASNPIRLDIVHSVTFPDPAFDLPILGIDLVAVNDVVTMAIADASPTSPAFNLPDGYCVPPKPPGLPREWPEWGRGIFGPDCVLLDRPEDPSAFVDYALSLALLHFEHVAQASPDETFMATRAKAQARYCLQQRRNSRTRAVLAKAFGPDLADAYMRDVMFDYPPPHLDQ